MAAEIREDENEAEQPSLESEMAPPSGHRCWMSGCDVILSSFLSYFFLGGISYTVGIYFIVWKEEFEISSRVAALFGSVHLGVLHLTVTLSGFLNHRYGFRRVVILGGCLASVSLFATAFVQSIYGLLFTFSVCAGLGIGITYVPGFTIVSYLEEGRETANGIASSGQGLGMLIMSYVSQAAIEAYHWRGAMIIMSGVALHYCAIGLMMRPPPEWRRIRRTQKLAKENGTLKKSSKFAFHIYKNPDVVMYLIQFCTLTFGMSLTLVHISAMARTLGATGQLESLPVSILGLTSIIGRAASGVIGQNNHVDTFLFILLSSLLAGVSAILFPFLRTYASLVTWSVCYGLLISPENSLYQILLLYLVDISDLNGALPHLITTVAFGMVLGGPAAGWIYDATQDYGHSFRLGGATLCLGTLLLVWPYIKHRRRNLEGEQVKMAANFSSGSRDDE